MKVKRPKMTRTLDNRRLNIKSERERLESNDKVMNQEKERKTQETLTTFSERSRHVQKKKKKKKTWQTKADGWNEIARRAVALT